MTTLYTGVRGIAAVTATTAQSGYPASNIALESIDLPWRSASTGSNDVVIDLGASLGIKALMLHDVNFTSAAIAYSDDNVSYTSAGTLSAAASRFGRYRGLLAFVVTKRYVKITISAGTPADNLAYWRIGSAWVMSTAVAVVAPDYGLKMALTLPAVSTDLPNGKTAEAATGQAFETISGTFTVTLVRLINTLLADMYAGRVVLDMEYSGFGAAFKWPLKMRAKDGPGESVDQFNMSKISFSAREVV